MIGAVVDESRWSSMLDGLLLLSVDHVALVMKKWSEKMVPIEEGLVLFVAVLLV